MRGFNRLRRDQNDQVGLRNQDLLISDIWVANESFYSSIWRTSVPFLFQDSSTQPRVNYKSGMHRLTEAPLLSMKVSVYGG